MDKKLLPHLDSTSTQGINDITFLNSNPKTLYRSLYIPLYEAPCLLEDDLNDMKRYLFYGYPTYSLSYDNETLFILSSRYENDYTSINFFATTLWRSLYTSSSDKPFTIYGPCLVIGMDDDTNPCSVSIDLIDSTINLMTRYDYDTKQRAI